MFLSAGCTGSWGERPLHGGGDASTPISTQAPGMHDKRQFLLLLTRFGPVFRRRHPRGRRAAVEKVSCTCECRRKKHAEDC
jgi:hypothetical protein